MTTLFVAFALAAPVLKEKPASPLPEGEWIAESNIENGKEVLGKEGMTLTFDEKSMTLKRGVRDQPHVMRVSFDPAARPPAIDVDYSGRGGWRKGIFKIEGDTLMICLNEAAKGDRPKEFGSESPTVTLIVLKRAKK